MKNGNFGINNTDPAKRLDVNGSLRFNTGIASAGRVLLSTATDGSAEWGTVGDSGIEDVERSIFIDPQRFYVYNANPSNPNITNTAWLNYDRASANNSSRAIVFISLPLDYAGGPIYIDVYFSPFSLAAGTNAGFTLEYATITPGAPFSAQQTLTAPLPIVTNGVGNSTVFKQTFTITGLNPAVKMLYINGLQRSSFALYQGILGFLGMEIRYTAKR